MVPQIFLITFYDMQNRFGLLGTLG